MIVAALESHDNPFDFGRPKQTLAPHICGREVLVQQAAQTRAQQRQDRYIKPHLGPVNNVSWNIPVEELAQQVLIAKRPQTHRQGKPERKLRDPVIQQWFPPLDADRGPPGHLVNTSPGR